MKKIFVTLTVLMTVATTFATTNPVANYTFNSADAEVAIELERVSTEVKMHILVKDIAQYDHIIIERSPDGGNYFGQCKYITCAEEKTENGYMLKVDKYPFPASKDSYYRIKTISKDGITRAYPAVTLSSVAK